MKSTLSFPISLRTCGRSEQSLTGSDGALSPWTGGCTDLSSCIGDDCHVASCCCGGGCHVASCCCGSAASCCGGGCHVASGGTVCSSWTAAPSPFCETIDSLSAHSWSFPSPGLGLVLPEHLPQRSAYFLPLATHLARTSLALARGSRTLLRSKQASTHNKGVPRLRDHEAHKVAIGALARWQQAWLYPPTRTT